MIVDALLSFFQSIIDGIVGLIPEIEPPDLSGMVAAMAPVFEAVGWLNKYVPVDQAVIALGLMVTWWAVLYAIKFGIWVLTKAHVLGGE